MMVRRWFHSRGYRYRLHDRRLPGTPDMVLPRYKSVIFVHGCFWHQHAGCRFAARPSNNTDFWSDKLSRNRQRFSQQEQLLAQANWTVFVIWECETRGPVELDKTASLVAQQMAVPSSRVR